MRMFFSDASLQEQTLANSSEPTVDPIDDMENFMCIFKAQVDSVIYVDSRRMAIQTSEISHPNIRNFAPIPAV